jgi:membrane-associated protease RseP (regulator of RpoE activity)
MTPPQEDARESVVLEPLRWRLALGLFLATVGSTFWVGAWQVLKRSPGEVYTSLRAQGLRPALWGALGALGEGWRFAVPLLTILLSHEFGHWLLARRHRVSASLPLFIPFPNLFGTMGAVIAMRGRIRTRDALVDIGASGPLAGLVVALGVMVVGLQHSAVKFDRGSHGVLLEGDSLLYLLLKRLVCGPLPDGHGVWLHPAAFAAWAGFFVTMMNLLPIGQLDGGHVAYALFGPRANALSRALVWALAALSLGVAAWVVAVTPRGDLDATAFTPATIWLLWAALTRGLLRLYDDAHPEVDDTGLSPSRRALAWLSLGCFVLLFMPVPVRLL